MLDWADPYNPLQWAEPMPLIKARAALRGKECFYSDGDTPGSHGPGHAKPAALGNGSGATKRSSLPTLSFLTLLLVLASERSLLLPVAGGWVLAHTRGCWISRSGGTCFHLACQCFSWMPPSSLPLLCGD